MELAVECETVHKIFMSTDKRISARCTSDEEKQGIDAAAALEGLTTSKFILMHMRKIAAAVLREHGKAVPFLDENKEGQTYAAVSARDKRP